MSDEMSDEMPCPAHLIPGDDDSAVDQRARADKAEAEVARLTVEIERRQKAYEQERATMRREIVTLQEGAAGNYWHWQGDGEDHLESLSCPVLISADQLRAVLAEKGDAHTCTEACALGDLGHCGRTLREYETHCEKRLSEGLPQRRQSVEGER